MRKCTAMLRTMVLASIGSVLLGCFDVTTEISFDSDSSGQVRLRYEVPEETYYMGVFDRESSFLPIPITRSDFARAARLSDGLSLRSYSHAIDGGMVTVDGVFQFDSLDALNRLYGGGRRRAVRFNEQGAERTAYTQLLFPGVGNVKESTREFFSAYGGDHTITFVVDPIDPVREANIGTITGGGERAEMTLSMAELGEQREAVIWELVW